MVDQQHSGPAAVGQLFEPRQVGIVPRIGIVRTSFPHFLQRIDDDQRHPPVFPDEGFDLSGQAIRQSSRMCGQIQVFRWVLRDVQQPVLQPVIAVLQAQIEHRTLLCRMSPDLFSACHLLAQPQRQPALSCLWRSRQDVQALHQQVFHRIPRRFQYRIRQCAGVDRSEPTGHQYLLVFLFVCA